MTDKDKKELIRSTSDKWSNEMIKKASTTVLLILLFIASMAYAGSRSPGWVMQTANVQAQGVADMYFGATTLKRTKFGIEGRIMAKVGMAGEAYTVWLVIFNNPQYCATTPCSADDLPEFAGGMGDPRVDVAVINGSAAISASDGSGGGVINADFSAVGGKVPDGICCFGSLARNNGMKAEIHPVVDKHPPATMTDPTYWTTHLTVPGGPGAGVRFSIFLPPQ